MWLIIPIRLARLSGFRDFFFLVEPAAMSPKMSLRARFYTCLWSKASYLNVSALGAVISFNGLSLARLVSATMLRGVCVATSLPRFELEEPELDPHPFM